MRHAFNPKMNLQSRIASRTRSAISVFPAYEGSQRFTAHPSFYSFFTRAGEGVFGQLGQARRDLRLGLMEEQLDLDVIPAMFSVIFPNPAEG
jgi:hypothetical protein